MTQQIWKPILIGISVGALFYFAPFFLFRGFFFFIAIALLFRFFWWGRWYHGYRGFHRGHDPLFADAIRSMSAEEYENFRKRNYDVGSGSPGKDKDRNPEQ
ncbi:MAG TPA: hypothetical protein VK666_19300 [Chryseolinea sp.]|nr:hypothetical protein [Chryseolinea sp.]